MGCFGGTISKQFRRMITWVRERKEKKREKKRLKDLRQLEARIAEVVGVQGEVEDVQAEVSQHSSLASTTLDIPADPSQASVDSGLGDLSGMSRQNQGNGPDSSTSSSSSSDGEGVALGVKSASSGPGGFSAFSLPMSLISDDFGPSSFSLGKYQSESSGMCSRPRAVEEARQVALHQRATDSLIAAVSRNMLPTILEDEDATSTSPDVSSRSHVGPSRSTHNTASVCSLPRVVD